MPVSQKKDTPATLLRRLALLWGSQDKVGRSDLSVKSIVTAALEIADADGLDALSMRNVAEKLGVGAMSLYTHIPGKADLIDLMRDTVYGELYTSVDEPSQQPGDWRDALRFIAQRNWELYQRHPWILQLTGGRPVLGPHEALKYEAELRPLDNIGLSDLDMDDALTLLLTHTEGCARFYANFTRAQQDSGLSDTEWWLSAEPFLMKVYDPTLFPVSGRVGNTAGETHQASANPEHTFRFGIERIIAGIAELIHSSNE